MNTTTLNPPKSVRQQAEDEFKKEQNEKAVKLLKVKLKELYSAKLIVDNVEREINDLEAQINDGDIPA